MLRTCAVLVGVLLFASSFASFSNVYAEESSLPEWVKNIFVWFGQGVVSESELLGAIEWLVENNIIKINIVSVDSDWKEQASKLYRENQQLEGDIAVLEKDMKYWKNKYNAQVNSQKLTLEDVYGDLLNEYAQEPRKEYYQPKGDYPKATLSDQTVTWEFYDSIDNFYVWEMPIETYEGYIRAIEPDNTFRLTMDNGATVTVRDHTQFVLESFTEVIDQVYDNAGSDQDFVYQVWYIVSQLTTYSYDIGEDPRWAIETFTRGGGDCEDLAILIADMIKSSKHSKNWDVQFVYFDADNPSRAKDVNHVVVIVDSGGGHSFIEPTAKTLDAMNQWNKIGISGWFFDV